MTWDKLDIKYLDHSQKVGNFSIESTLESGVTFY